MNPYDLVRILTAWVESLWPLVESLKAKPDTDFSVYYVIFAKVNRQSNSQKCGNF
jgi:hypothetical protein